MSASSPPPREEEGAKLLSEKEETSSLKLWVFSAGGSSLLLDQNGILGDDVVDLVSRSRSASRFCVAVTIFVVAMVLLAVGLIT